MPPKRSAVQDFDSEADSSSTASSDDRSQTRFASPSPPSQTDVWVVQEILAERVSPNGDRELLVVWKPEWIPYANVRDGNVLRSFCSVPKARFVSAAGDVLLPVERRSSLAAAIRRVQPERQHASAHAHSSDSRSDSAPGRSRETPRKSLGCISR